MDRNNGKEMINFFKKRVCIKHCLRISYKDKKCFSNSIDIHSCVFIRKENKNNEFYIEFQGKDRKTHVKKWIFDKEEDRDNIFSKLKNKKKIFNTWRL